MSKSSVFDTFVSTRTMATLMIIFALAIGSATFIEHYFDTVAAKKLIFNATWFKLLLVLLCVNFIGNIKRYRLLRKEKWSILLVHLGLILTIIGAGVTHYIGYEGIIRVAEGGAVNQMWSAEPYLEVFIVDEEDGRSYRYPHKLELSSLEWLNGSVDISINPFEKGVTEIKYVSFKPDIKYGAPIDSSENGINHLELVFANMTSEFLPEGGFLEKGEHVITYNNPKAEAINITGVYPNLQVEFPVDVMRMSMETQIRDTLTTGIHPFLRKHLHNLGSLNIVFKAFRPLMDYPLVADPDGQDLLTLNVAHNGESRNIQLWGGQGYMPSSEGYVIGGKTHYLRYGAIEMDLPFALELNDFILETYLGTDRASGYRSKVTLYEYNAADSLINLNGESHDIYMNHPLDYNGYRVFQSSYDLSGDSEVSVFSVNHDFWGTTITYIAYFLLSLGFVVTLFNKTSRFSEVGKKLNKMRKSRIAELTSIFILALFVSNSYAQDEELKYTPVSQEHCDEFNSLLVMSYTKRIQPCNSLAYDLIRKLTRKDEWKLEEQNVTLSPEQFMLDIFVEPGFWFYQPIIKFDARTGVGKEFGVEGKYLAYSDLFELIEEDGQKFTREKKFPTTDENGEPSHYTLDTLLNKAMQKKQGSRNTFDKEIIKLNEKVSIFWQVSQGQIFRIFPVVSDTTDKWINWFEPEAQMDISNGHFDENGLSMNKFLSFYQDALFMAKLNGDYNDANLVLAKLKEFQKSQYSDDIASLPSENDINLEISYNQMNLFNKIKNYYSYLALLLLPFTLIYSLSERPKKWMLWVIRVLVVFLMICGIAHIANLGIRCYIIGHAPWSDGYEALVTISAACVVAGFLFFLFSKSWITLGASSLLAFFILMTAGHSQYDPQLTDLEPVLKSYWLNIHVACLTISYGFFGLGFILTLINMGIFSFRSHSTNLKRTESVTKELTLVNEMTITVGLVLATIGTFLGGVWANESWGRYWGWDAKETWALVIVLVYAFIIHMRFVPLLRSKYALNLASVVGFASVIMTFVGVNYYLTKGLHSYARGDTPAFPWWVWVLIFAIIGLCTYAGFREKAFKQNKKNKSKSIIDDI